MDIIKIKELIETVKASGIAELDVKTESLSVKIVQQASQPVGHGSSFSLQPKEAVQSEANKELSDNSLQVKSPMVGTFYSSCAPDKLNYVKVGDRVNKGDVLCIIEAMKMMNKIESSESGIIKSILVENGSLVEFDEPLFLLEK